MDLSHSFTVPAPVDQAWATFMDLEVVGGCFPGATVTEASRDGFAGTVKVKLGPIALVYAGSGTFLERDDGAHRAVIEAKGKDKRGNGTAGATVTIQLTDTGEGTTRAEVHTDLSVTGKPAQFGRGVLQDVSDKLLQQFVGCIEGIISAPAPQVAPEPTAPEPTAPEPTGPEPTAPEPTTPEPTGRRPVLSVVPAPPHGEPALDLGAAVFPVVLRSYRRQLLVVLVVAVAVAVRAVWRRRSR